MSKLSMDELFQLVGEKEIIIRQYSKEIDQLHADNEQCKAALNFALKQLQEKELHG